jgi:hypothetical protein
MRDFRAASNQVLLQVCARSAPATPLLAQLHAQTAMLKSASRSQRSRASPVQPVAILFHRAEGNCLRHGVDASASSAGIRAALQKSRPVESGRLNPACFGPAQRSARRHAATRRPRTRFEWRYSVSDSAVALQTSGFSRPRPTPGTFPRGVARPAKYRPVPSRLERNGGWLATTRTNHRGSL